MEDSPAGKKTINNTFKESPKKSTISNQSQWSFGWQPGTRDTSNRPNTSNGIPLFNSGFNSYHNQSSILFGE